METTNNEDLVQLERALLVQLSAKKFYSTISDLDEQQQLHLRKIDSTIEKLYERRQEIWTSEGIDGSPNEFDLQEFLQGEQVQNDQKEPQLKSYLDLEDPVKRPATRQRLLMIVTFVLLILTGLFVGISLALRKPAADTNLPSNSPGNSSSASNSPHNESPPSPVVAGIDSSTDTTSTTTTTTTTADSQPTLTTPMKTDSPPIVDIPQLPAPPAAPATPPPPPPPPSPPSPPSNPQPFGVNLFQNAGFNNNACPGSSSTCYSSDSNSISPWRVVSDEKQYEISPVGFYSFAPNMHALDLNSGGANSPYTIQQTIPTAAGSRYRVSFGLNVNPCQAPVKTGFVSASGNNRLDFTASTETRTQTYDFTANGATTDISIGSSTLTGSCGPVVFGIQVVRIP